MLFNVINDVFQLFSLRILHYGVDHVPSIYIGENISCILEFASNLSTKVVDFIEKLLLLCNMIRER